jgi:hypothetical protein
MRSLSQAASQVFAPFFAGLMLKIVGIQGVLVIDFASFTFSILPPLLIRIPRPAVSAIGRAAEGSFWEQMRFGFGYIVQRRGLLGLLSLFVGINLAAALTYLSIIPAMILARTGGDELALASVQSALGLGGVVGGIVISLWGGTRRKIHLILAGAGLSFMFGDFLLAVGRGTPVWVIGAFVGAFFVPLIISGDRSIWQHKVAPDVQGRVFAVQSVFQQMTMPLGFLLAGPLADRVFEPAMQPGGALAHLFGGLVGTGAGAGMALMFVCTCLIGTTISFSGYLLPAVRNVEDDLPDHDAVAIEMGEAAA